MHRTTSYMETHDEWRLKQALWASWYGDMDECYRFLTAVCRSVVPDEDKKDE